MWFSDPSLFQVVRDSWSDPSIPLLDWVEDFTHKVCFWNKHCFGNIFHKKKHLVARIGGVQKALNADQSLFLTNLKKSLLSEYKNILKLEEEFWGLKSHDYTLEGDGNTKFFHSTTISHRRNNRILALKHNDSWVFEDSVIRNLVSNYFVDLFSSFLLSEPISFPPPSPFTILDASHHHALSIIPSDEEIKSVLWSFKPWKAPGPDGLHPRFENAVLRNGFGRYVTVSAVGTTHYPRFCGVIEIHRGIGRYGHRSGRNGDVTAVTARYERYRVSLADSFQKKTKEKAEKAED
ncbi:hypothetical protein ACSBR2_033208 [Camellia fascicularis]